MPARRRSRGHDRRHNTSGLIHSSGGTYTRSVSLSPSLLSLSLPRRVSVSLAERSRLLLLRTCVSSRCTHRANSRVHTRPHAHAHTHAHTHTRKHTQAHTHAHGRPPRALVHVLSRLSFFPPPLSSRRRELAFPPPTLVRVSAARESTHRDRAIY